MDTLEWVFKACSAAGGLALVLQIVMLFFGGDAGADHDVDMHPADHIGDGAFNLLSVRALTGFVAFFGLGGWWAASRGSSALVATLLAVFSGAVVMALVAGATMLQRKLAVEGNIHPENAAGQIARVYLKVPARRAGSGRVTLMLQGRSLELLALTDGDEIPTGAQVRIASVLSSDTCLVVPFTGTNEAPK